MSSVTLFLRFVVTDLIFDVVRFPIWWYSRGARRAGRWYIQNIRLTSDRLALKVLAQNLGRPMFADYSREGRIISFFMRIIQIVVSSVLFVLWFLVLSAIFIAYFFVPLGVLWLILYTFPYGN